MEFSRQEYWSGLLFPTPGDFTDPGIPVLGIYPEETRVEKATCIQLFFVALFTVARTWKQPRYPSTKEWINKLWYIYTMEYDSAEKGTQLSQF